MTAPAGVEIRAATVADVPAMRALGASAPRATYEQWNEYSLGAAARSGRMLVAERDGALVGLLESDRLDAARAAIWKLCVAPEARRSGIGRALLERYLATAGASEVLAEHDAGDAAAAAFLERLGFALAEVEEDRGARTVRRVLRLSSGRAARR